MRFWVSSGMLSSAWTFSLAVASRFDHFAQRRHAQEVEFHVSCARDLFKDLMNVVCNLLGAA